MKAQRDAVILFKPFALVNRLVWAAGKGGQVKKKTIDKWEAGLLSGYVWPKPKRISIYLFENQIKMLEEIAADGGVRKRHIVFECVQAYISQYLRNKEERERRP